MSRGKDEHDPHAADQLDPTPLPRALPYHLADPTGHGVEKISATDVDPTIVERSFPPPLPDPDDPGSVEIDVDVDVCELTDDLDDPDGEERTEPFDLLGARTRAGRLSTGEGPTSSLFAVLPEADRPALLARFVQRSVIAGSIVIRLGEPTPPLVLVARGRLDVRIEPTSGAPVQLEVVGAGAFVGEIALLTRTASSATVVAATNAVLLELAPAVFYEVCAQYPDLWAALKDVAERRRRAYEQRVRLAR